MRKIILLSVLLVAAVGGGVYWYLYTRAVEEYPVAILENIIKSNLVSSTTYTRLNVKRTDDSSSVIIGITFASQNRLGAMVDGEAWVKYIPKEDFEMFVSGPFLPEVVKNFNMKLRAERGENFPYDRLSIFSLNMNGTEYSLDKVERLNSDMIMWREGFPFSPPTLRESKVNRFKSDREYYAREARKNAQ